MPLEGGGVYVQPGKPCDRALTPRDHGGGKPGLCCSVWVCMRYVYVCVYTNVCTYVYLCMWVGGPSLPRLHEHLSEGFHLIGGRKPQGEVLGDSYGV